ncbi:AarF/ABC1/UbiB kinase family protein [Mycobacterium sp. IS-3022]|uniref:ABC1 kinase family protein n=1 Tax=Mycobacterium sp. IS-3022 TaxID=1772277 RepID=UPI000741682E|nr:AarF/ABC1/UbiB kinase family protein [Mycobacterium sp. IS-3022]KUH97240.1 ATP-binding protein [Mycobacterium sp. IS-3022]KUH97444.1 ATP-binding protein [Mycobacterium sp. IS-3022]
MTGAVPKARISRGGKLGRLAAEQAVRSAGTRLSMIGRSQRAKSILAERATIESADQLVTVLGGMKGAAMKLGQMLSVLDLDLVPESHRERFREKLAALRDHAPIVPFASMRKVIETDIGPLRRIFADFNDEAIAAASVGQVYRAKLRDGRDVAVKVQYPGIDTAIKADMRNLALFAKIGKTVWPTLGANGFLEEISRNLVNELDYLQEARTQHYVAQKYRGHPLIHIPDSVLEFSRERVLITEYVDGTSFEDLRKLPAEERNDVGELLYRFYIGSLFQHNEFCGDPHPGNVMQTADGKVVFIDFGLFNRMDPTNVDFERVLLRAAVEGRANDIYHLLIGRGIVDADADITPQECLDYLWAAGEWHLVDDEITVTPELATGALVVAIDPRGSDHFTGIKRQLLPPEHIFSRRADFFTFGALGQLVATNNWHRIAREWIYDDPPATDIGRAIADWENRPGKE